MFRSLAAPNHARTALAKRQKNKLLEPVKSWNAERRWSQLFSGATAW
jgi:hypothetical protein